MKRTLGSITGAALLLLAGVLAASCTTVEPAADDGGARLWAENCGRCHNLRPPLERGDETWTLIAHHMRVRANLTAHEHRLIIGFLKGAN